MNTNVDDAEIKKFSKLSAHWWDPQGEFATLHAINPLRLEYINKKVPVLGKTVLDVGCGGGLLSEGLATLGADVTGIDMSEQALRIANLHQLSSGTNVKYLHKTAETLAAEEPENFDIITCLEMLEHVPDPNSVIAACSRLLKPKGFIFFSTLNRNMISYLQAIIGAEYLLQMLPKNTHDFAKFIRPSELATCARAAKLTAIDMVGINYSPIAKIYTLSKNVKVNYLMLFQKSN